MRESFVEWECSSAGRVTALRKKTTIKKNKTAAAWLRRLWCCFFFTPHLPAMLSNGYTYLSTDTLSYWLICFNISSRFFSLIGWISLVVCSIWRFMVIYKQIEYKSVKFIINLLFEKGAGGIWGRKFVCLKPYMTLYYSASIWFIWIWAKKEHKRSIFL